MVKEWRYTTIRPKPNSMYMFETPEHRLGYVKRESLATGRIQYRPRCFGCKWSSEAWMESRNEFSRRLFKAHVKPLPKQESLLGGNESA